MKNKQLTYSPILLLLTFVAGSFLFIELNYKYWYAFMEQYFMFQTTEQYFFTRLAELGGLTQYATEWLSIWFIKPFGAALIISTLLGSISGSFYYFLKKCGFQPSMLVAILPSFLFWLFPQESIASMLTVLIALLTACLYTLPKANKFRYLLGVILLTIAYPTTAPSPILAVSLMAIYECYTQANKEKWVISLLLIAYTLVLPLIGMRIYYVVPMKEAFLSKHLFHPEFPMPSALFWIAISFPAITLTVFLRKGKAFFSNETLKIILAEILLLIAIVSGIVYLKNPLEQAYLYDYYARQEKWDAIVQHAKTHPIRDMDALVYSNMALSHTNQFVDYFLQLPQKGEAGFIPYDPHTRMGLVQASEVSWLVGQVNASQRFAFVGVLSSERCVQPRLMKRLVETYLVTGEYRAAEKYIKLLETTPHYRDWAKAQRPLLDPATCASTDWVAQKRAFLPITDNPFDLTKALPSALAFLIDDHPDNRPAFEYGMGYLLAHKNLPTFMHYMQLMRDRGETFPIRYQEAICLYYSTIDKNPAAFNSYPIQPEVKSRFMEYMQTARKFHQAALKRQYGDTYYYYMQFGPKLTDK